MTIQPIIVATLYQFVDFPNYSDWRQPLRTFCDAQGIKGTLHLASEGINGTICGSREALDGTLAYIKAIPGFASLVHRETQTERPPFARMKVKIKKEIVTFRVSGIDPTQQTGVHVAPQDWNALIEDPETIVIDTRNDYEVAVGTFKNALNPKTAHFVSFPDFVSKNLNPAQHKKVAMFCTGGIRCEKASAYMIQQGFEAVYQLNGGILNYLSEVPAEDSLWQGQCFVFDERVTV